MPIKKQIKIYNEVINHMLFIRKKTSMWILHKFWNVLQNNDKFKSMESVEYGGRLPYSHHSGKRDRKTVHLRSVWPSSWVLGQSELLRTLSKSKNIKCAEEYKMEKNIYKNILEVAI